MSDFDFDDFDDDDLALDDCPKCGRHYDEVDYDYQFCSKCGWDESKKKWGKRVEPTDVDFMAGEADILTGRWN